MEVDAERRAFSQTLAMSGTGAAAGVTALVSAAWAFWAAAWEVVAGGGAAAATEILKGQPATGFLPE